MTPSSNSLIIGKPRFLDEDLEKLAASQGALAAWQAAYGRYGIQTPNHVAGDYAIAFQTPDGGVFMAVDKFAVRSLCYRHKDRQLSFAERADEVAGGMAEIDPQAIFDYFYFHTIPSPRTIFQGVYRLPPAHYAIFNNGVLTVAPYWVPTFEEPRQASFDQLRTEFRELLQQAVARQLDGGKAGCFLSGGTDSSTVAGMIGQVLGRPAASYSIGFEAEGYDEMEFARLASKQFNTEHHEYYVTPQDLLRSIPQVAASYDQPFGNSSALPAYYCAKMAREDGVTRILAGDGGDELFGGNSRYSKQRVFNFYQNVPGVIRESVLEPFLGTGIGKGIPLIRKAASYVEQASVPMPDRLQMYNLVTRLGLKQVFTEGFLSGVDLAAPLQLQRQVWNSPQASSATNRELAFDWRFTLGENDLPKVCGTTRLAGLEVGFPMLDEELLEFSLKLPTDYKLKGLKLRWFFKEALRGFLPDEILTKKKQGFGLPFGVWTAKDSALKSLAEDSVRGLVDREILRADFVDALFSRYLYEHPGYYGEMIWISMMMEQWFRGQSARSASANS
ncbi:MAG: asparagine synthase [Betaproteobacteria bacterium HGW-Betaproteobacteria-7]|jgi:asparagine synthase (glutamine-hydrolysing)|nr:MAG: asparagine synthase [Betaproteobacteria bacterium HGW-Betaproteobacteria-7]